MLVRFQTALLQVEAGGTDTIEMRQGSSAWVPTPILANASTAYGTAAVVPKSFTLAPFEVRAAKGPGTLVNAPDPWFIFGDSGDSATPGGWARVVGNSVGLGGAPATKLRLTPVNGSAATVLTATEDAKFNRWHAHFALPADLPPAVYEASVGNAGTYVDLCTFIFTDQPCLSTLTVKPTPALGSGKMISVADHGAVQPGVGRNATLAVRAALAAAAAAGPGTTVLFPRGTYFIYGAIEIPEGVTMRGAATKLTSIYFQEQNYTDTPNCDTCTTKAPDAYITGAANVTSWHLADVTVYVTSFFNNVIRIQPGSNNVSVKRTRVRANSYFCLEPTKGKASRGRNTFWDTGFSQGSRFNALLIAGTNIFVEDNDLYSTNDVISTLSNGAAGASYMHIANNRIYNGGTAHWGISWKQTIFEDNVMLGSSATAMGSNYAQYSHANGNPHVQNIYHNNNSMSMVWGNDREMMTLDGGGGVYFGLIEKATHGSASVTIAKPATGPQPAGAVCILNGTGTGQCRRIVSSSADHKTWTLDMPYAKTPDATSTVVIIPWVGHLMWTNNRYSDGGAIQLYATGLEIVLADSHFERTGGMIPGWGLQEETSAAFNPTLHNQALGNTIEEGNHVWNYNDQDYDKSHPAHADSAYHGDRIEPWWFCSLSFGPPSVSLSRFIVFRGNSVENNGGINIQGASTNILVEKNVIANSDVGIHVNYSVVMGGIVVRDNVEPSEIQGQNYDPYPDEGPGTKFCCIKDTAPNCTMTPGAPHACCVPASGANADGPCPEPGQKFGVGNEGKYRCCDN